MMESIPVNMQKEYDKLSRQRDELITLAGKQLPQSLKSSSPEFKKALKQLRLLTKGINKANKDIANNIKTLNSVGNVIEKAAKLITTLAAILV
ncbi:hypothetical protein [Photobacterium rosenbergii]|nr:hypothetical protein [Photobacterium rosenbergii]